MKLQPDRADGVNVIHAYTADSVSVNGTTYSHAVLVPHTGDVLPWTAQSWAELNDAHFQTIADARPELVVFGSGASLHFMKPAVLRPLIVCVATVASLALVTAPSAILAALIAPVSIAHAVPPPDTTTSP